MKRLILFSIFLVIGCGVPKELPPPVARTIDYSQEVRPLLVRYCYSCHGPTKQKGAYRLDIKEIALKGEIIKPGASSGSPFIHHLLGTHDRSIMPPEPPRLSPEQVSILRAWIDQGASWNEER